MKEIVREAEKFALSEIKKYGMPSLDSLELSNRKGKELSKKLGANSDIVQVGTNLMDIKLGQAFSEGKIGEHISMSAEAAREFLSRFRLEKGIAEKIINCIEGHHGTKKWVCKEAEICANADCYRFLLARSWLAYISDLGKRNMSVQEILGQAEKKADEKWGILSLEICKKELEPQYRLIKGIIQAAKYQSS
jgi:hypothetical protein